ncbi:hypothetical protein AB2M62_04745 [Sphingomonas sp. MMS12-HWE2-04]|uniref:hypothetical protein n=1 Tax=Sphingomonas sp. MMS12-HWE2-04 TaxID=3234199 RepID=UPI00384F7D7C
MALALFAGAPGFTAPRVEPDNAELEALFVADQAVRTSIKPEQIADRAFVEKMLLDDQSRRVAARKLLDAGALHTAGDFYAAAYIFQHGRSADDYLLAHSLAVAAVAKGKAEARWIAAATLDRYLQKIGQQQIYGTQFITSRATGPTMEPYNPQLVPDALRSALDVPVRKEQDARLETMTTVAPGRAD